MISIRRAENLFDEQVNTHDDIAGQGTFATMHEPLQRRLSSAGLLVVKGIHASCEVDGVKLDFGPFTCFHGPMLDPRAQKLAAFIRANLLQIPDSPIDLDTSLVDNGSLDSMGATLLAAFIEEQFGARLREEDLVVERIETIRKILHVIDSSTSDQRS